MIRVIVQRALAADAAEVVAILHEAAAWLAAMGDPLWKDGELAADLITSDVAAGYYYLARVGGAAAGTMRLQLRDGPFWPEMLGDDAVYLHRLAVARRFAGGGVSVALLDRAVAEVRCLGRRYLRLDCEAARTALRRFYEAYGLVHHSDAESPPYVVSRYQLDCGEQVFLL